MSQDCELLKMVLLAMALVAAAVLLAFGVTAVENYFRNGEDDDA